MGTLYTGPVADIVIGPGESALIKAATLTGTVTIDGGNLVVTDSTIDGKIVSENSSTVIIVQSVLNGRIFMLPPSCPADTNNSGSVNVTDLLALLAAWGACP